MVKQGIDGSDGWWDAFWLRAGSLFWGFHPVMYCEASSSHCHWIFGAPETTEISGPTVWLSGLRQGRFQKAWFVGSHPYVL